MISKPNIKTLKIFFTSPENEFTSTEISNSSKIPYISIFKALEELVEKKILNKKIKGKTGIYQLNYANPSIQKFGELIENENREELLKEKSTLKIVVDDILKEFSELFSDIIVSIIIFGSFVKGIETKESDIDFLFIIRSGTKREYKNWNRKILDLCRKISEMHSKRISPFILTTNDFREGLKKRQILVYEVYKNHVIIFGTEFYTKEVLEWLKKSKIF